MRKLKLTGLWIFFLAFVFSTSVLAAPPTPEEVKQEKAEIRKKSKEILATLYKARRAPRPPSTRRRATPSSATSA